MNMEELEKIVYSKIVYIITLIILIFIFINIINFVINSFYRKKYIHTDFIPEYRRHYSTVLLNDNRLLIVGGETEKAFPDNEIIYNPITRTFVNIEQLNVPRTNPSTILLDDGRVLIIGGYKGDKIANKAEIFNQKTNKFKIIGETSFCNSSEVRFTKFNNGNIYIHCNGGEAIFDIRTDSFVNVPEGPSKVAHCMSTILADGKVMFIKPIYFNQLFKIIIFDPVTMKYTMGQTIKRDNTLSFMQILTLPNGKILLISNYKNFLNGNNKYIEKYDYIEEYDIKNNTFKYICKLKKPRIPDAGVLLPNGRIYFPSNNIYVSEDNHILPFDFKNLFLEIIMKPSCEVFDPGTGKTHYTRICPATFCYGKKYYLLQNNKLLLIGCGILNRKQIINVDLKEVK